MEHLDHTVKIIKTGPDHYRYLLRDGFRQIEEENIDGPKLLAMLGNEMLINSKNEALDPNEVLFHFDNHPVGYEVVIGVKKAA